MKHRIQRMYMANINWTEQREPTEQQLYLSTTEWNSENQADMYESSINIDNVGNHRNPCDVLLHVQHYE